MAQNSEFLLAHLPQALPLSVGQEVAAVAAVELGIKGKAKGKTKPKRFELHYNCCKCGNIVLELW